MKLQELEGWMEFLKILDWLRFSVHFSTCFGILNNKK